MSRLQEQLAAISRERLQGMRRGLEKESLRTQGNGELALTPHPQALGSALTHPCITTDFSESQIEIVTGTHADAAGVWTELAEIHRYVYQVLAEQGDEMLWVSSMPCRLPSDETIPIGRYGTSNVGRSKSVYRMGLSHRYGRRMQTISGIHYNWSLPGIDSDQYFGLIRNFRRQAPVLLYLFGASPAVCGSFLDGREHRLQPLGERGLHLPHATSLRMGRLGYQSDAQATLAVSYNSLDGYGASLEQALTEPYPAYEALGVRNPGGDYNQLSTTLLQIENEFYGTIRPKRTVFPGERPLHALRERGVQYVEVRCMDLDPFEPLGISVETMRFLDVFLLHCLLADSPPDSPQEIELLKRNQNLAAERGREPGLLLTLPAQSGPRQLTLHDWATELLQSCGEVAAHLDRQLGGQSHRQALARVQALLDDPQQLPSARVLQAIAEQPGSSFMTFVHNRSEQTRAAIMQQPFSAAQRERYTVLGLESVEEQRQVETRDTMPFEIYRQQYLLPSRLGLRRPQLGPTD